MLTLYPDLLPRNYLITNLDRLISENVDITVQILKIMSMHKNEIFTEALNKLVENTNLTLNALELVYNLVMSVKVEQRYLDAFVHRWFAACKEMENSIKNKNLRLVCKFVMELIKKEKFDCTSKLEVWFHYCSHFGSNGYVKEFKESISAVINKV